ncbi:hypothetical protein [Aureimonas leprariae]|uniref:Uncharacterized protein n=1 Tax=Plantimonas leprariae TaxID=2615207 RepID=A0A7V7TUN2_9HYPH|nr:hypothetical protein [Aureimonas leprariae]KAB0676281.1 hypothetical protein F6X38_21485 [Aureimonas leprariae]
MSETALAEGVAAFRRGASRTSNPFDASSEDWMCWRDGWDQANALAGHIEQGTAEAFVRAAVASRELVEDA